MDLLLACSCGLDPASEGMIVQTGIAVVISAPFWFRERIAGAFRRLRGLPPKGIAAPTGDEAETNAS